MTRKYKESMLKYFLNEYGDFIVYIDNEEIQSPEIETEYTKTINDNTIHQFEYDIYTNPEGEKINKKYHRFCAKHELSKISYGI